MYEVFRGVRVVELATYLAVPAAGAIMGSWGADVIKIEHPETGDPYRAMRTVGMASGWEIANRNKRSIGVNIRTQGGRKLTQKLLESADVLLTNLRDGPLARAGLKPETMWQSNPGLVYARGTGYGRRGPDSESAGFDAASTWTRSSLAYRMTPAGAPELTLQPGSLGDLVTAISLAGGTAAALYQREKTGRGIEVDTSLYHVGLWMASQSIETAEMATGPRRPNNPLVGSYCTSDDRHVFLCLLQSDRDWPSLCECIGRSDLLADPRFDRHEARELNADACREELRRTFSRRTMAEWRDALTRFSGAWSPALSPNEVAQDPQALLNGYVIESQAAGGGRIVSPPVQFGNEMQGEIRSPSEHGQDTEEVLMGLGLSTDDIMDLRIEGAVL